ncbi:MAG: glycosyltransferase [Nanoarchaeota archaeon]|nr:glycosyltransferase [Nanoarchaeota archaeon]
MGKIKIPEKFEKGIVTVIIPTYHAEMNIEKCLKSIRNQTYRRIEIIVVDQTSPDATVKIARKYSDKIIIIEKPKFYSPPSHSRNIGAAASRGEFIVNIDADMELEKTLIENCVKIARKKECAGVIIHEKDVPLNFWAKCRALEKECMINDRFFEGVRFISREAFRKIKGYDSSLGSGEDWDLHARIKETGKIFYADYFIFHHTGKKHLIKNFRKMVDYGRTFDRYIKKHPELAKKQLTIFRGMYLRNWKTLVKKPILTLGLVILKLSEFAGAFIGKIIAGN